MAGMTDPDRIWTEAAGRLRSEIGEGPFSSYIAPRPCAPTAPAS